MKVGFAVADITPELGIYLTGYGRPERLATGVHSPLAATAMLLQDEHQEAVVIGLDWCYMDKEAGDEIRRGVSAVSGIPEGKILLCCSHTHSAPHTAFGRTLGRVSVDPENKGIAYVRKNIPVIAEAVCKARAAAKEVEAGFAAGKTQTGVSRRGMDENGYVVGFVGDPDLIYDSNMTAVLFRDRETHEEVGILVHCSSHNTCMGADRNISSDWCGVMRKRMGQRYKVPILFLNGAIGDVGPRTNRWFDCWEVYRTRSYGFAAGGGDGPASAEEVGYRAATDALRLLENMRYFRSDLPLKMATATIKLPQSIPMSVEEANQVIAKLEPKAKEGSEPPMEYQIARTALETWKQPPQPEFEFEHTMLAFGPVALVPFPFEMFSVFSLRLRKYGPYEYTLLCSNTNGYFGYMPDRGAIACGGYEVSSRRVNRPYVLDPEAGDLTVTQCLKNLRDMESSAD